MNLIRKLIDILTTPSHFFANLRSERDIAVSIYYLAGLSLFNLLLAAVIGRLLQPSYYALLSHVLSIPITLPVQSVPMLIFSNIFGFIFALVFSFAFAGLLHGWIVLFGGKAEYTKTYQLYVYSSVPSFLFGWLPIASFISSIYSLVLIIIGTQKVHGMKKSTAILMYAIPMVIFYALLLALILFGASVFKDNPQLLA